MTTGTTEGLYEAIAIKCRYRDIAITAQDVSMLSANEIDILSEWDGKGDTPAVLERFPALEEDGEPEADEEPDELETLKGQVDRLQRHRKKEQELERDVQEAEAHVETAKAKLKDAKAKFDRCVAKLRAHIRRDPNQNELPFNDDDPPEATAADDWGREPITALTDHGLTANQCEKLDAARIETVRELREFIARDAHWHRKIKGVGEGTVDKITDALNSYQQAHPEQADNGDDVLDYDAALEQLENIMDDCGKVPEAGADFADSVHQDAADMHNNITEHESVTAEQSRAIRNWRRELDGWLEQGE